MRFIFVFLIGLLVFFSYELLQGDASFQKITALEQKVKQQELRNDAALARNNAMSAEIKDLNEGTQAIEEIARSEQGMLRENEMFIQILPVN